MALDGRSDSEEDNVDDIFFSSLQTLYSLTPISFSSAGSIFSYTSPSGNLSATVQVPDTSSNNWSLHASSIWSSAIVLADHIDELHLDKLFDNNKGRREVRILELGAGAGLPGILVAKHVLSRNLPQLGCSKWEVTLSDYPDDNIIQMLGTNIRKNGVERYCKAIPYAWGSSVTPFHSPPNQVRSSSTESNPLTLDTFSGFDLILAADTLWNTELHSAFLETLQLLLHRSPTARVHLVAGLHTGRYALQGFFDLVSEPKQPTCTGSRFEIESICERGIRTGSVREWLVDRSEEVESESGDGERERERRDWVIWAVMKWKDVE